MKAVAVVQPNRVEIVELERPVPGPYQALLRMQIGALCNATDRKLVDGHFPGVDSYPLILGHEGVGVVEQIGSKVRTFQVGDHVISGYVAEFSDPKYTSGWGGFCEYTLAVDHDAMVADGVADQQHGWCEFNEIQRPVDKDIPLEECALLCTWREVYGGFRDFSLQPGDDILIFGAGPVGLSFTKFAKLLGLGWVGVVEPNQARHEIIRQMGADAVFTPEEVDKISEQRGPLDAVIDAVGNEAIVNQSLPFIKMGGSICIYGVLGADSIRIDKSRGPYNFNLYIHQWPTRPYEREAMEPLCRWIREGKLAASEFVSHRCPIEEINQAIRLGRRGEVIKCLFDF